MAERHSILPPSATARLPLVAVMAIMSYLAALSLAAALVLSRATDAWSTNLAGAVTVQIKPDPRMVPEQQRRAVLKVLAEDPAVVRAHALDDSEVRRLLEPWLGKNVSIEELPMPQLIDVKLDRNAAPSLERLSERIAGAAPGASLDDHRRWNERLVGFTNRLAGIGLLVLGLIVMATVSIVIFATRAGLSANQETVEVLHTVGARDAYIATQFERHFVFLALRAGLIGVGAAALTVLAGSVLAPASDLFLPQARLWPIDLLIVLGVPIAAALVAMYTARITVLRVLRGLY